MEIQTVPEVPNLLIVENFFTDEEQISIRKEIAYLHPKLNPPEETGAPTNTDVETKKHNMGVFINEIYFNPIKYSDIAKALDKVCSPSFADLCVQHSPFYRYLYCQTRAGLLLSEYRVGDYYKSHVDICTVTALAYLVDDTPHTGGDLFFSDYNHTVKVKNNMLLLMPSYLYHEVTKVDSEDPEFKRYSISKFITAL